MKILLRVENHTKCTEIAKLNCNEFEIELLEKLLIKLSKVETKRNLLMGNNYEIHYIVVDKPDYDYDTIKSKLEHMISDAVKSYNEKVDLLNIVTKRVNKRNGRPINESLLKHYE
jgi:hypothetical protein